MRRLRFLPLFFTALGVVFAIAVFVRIRSYQIGEEIAGNSARGGVAAAESIATGDDAAAASQTAQQSSAPVAPDFEPVPLLEERAARFPVAEPSATAPPPLAPAPRRTAPAAQAGQQEPAGAAPRPPVSSATTTRAVPDSTAPTQSPAQERASSRADERETRSERERETDPTSDSTPPQLLAVEFIPPQIADGEETVLIVQATDDLSGIRSISGTIIAPSGAVQGFACQREGETNRFIARVLVPKEAAEGVWSINYMNLMDNASNAVAMNAARGGIPPGASFRVISSRPDTEGPTLQAVWLDRRSMRGGEKNLLYVRAHDDRAGVNLVSGVFRSPSRLARVGFVCRASGEGLWTCELGAPNCADCGEWQLEQLQLQDKANNMTTLRSAQNEMLAAVRVDVSSDLCDADPPSLESIALDQAAVSNVAQSTIIVTARLSDDACGVLSVSGQATGPATTGIPPRLYFSFTPAGDPHTWVARLVVPRLAAKGVWRVSFLQLLDRGQNLKAYSQNDPLLANATFVVQ